MNFDRLTAAAAAAGVALEINCQIERLDLDEHHARLARDRGVKLIIDSDAHSPAALGLLRWGVTVARRAWLEPGDVLNTLPVEPSGSRCAAIRASARARASDDTAQGRPARRDPPAVLQDQAGHYPEDFDRAIDLLKSLATEAERERATVYMEGPGGDAQGVREVWQGRQRRRGKRVDASLSGCELGQRCPRAPPGAALPARCGRSSAS